MRKMIFGTLVALAIVAAAAPASAEYVCSWNWVPTSGGLGSSGYVRFDDYTGPGCTGTFLKTWIACSTNATSGSCPSSANYHYTSTQLSAMAAGLSQAAIWNTRVLVAPTTCNGGAGGCMAYFNFRSYGS